MSTFTRCTAATNQIYALNTDTPNATLGMSGEDLRKEFDKAGTAIKTYINDTLLAELEGTGCAAKLGIAAITGMLADNVQAALEELYAAATASLGAGEVKTANIDDGAVTTAKVADSAITYAKTTGVQKVHSATTATIPVLTAETDETVSVTGVTASNTVLVTPAPSSYNEWRDCGVRCKTQGSGTLTFVSEAATTNSLTANVVILD